MKNGIGLLRGRSGTVDTNCHWFQRLDISPSEAWKFPIHGQTCHQEGVICWCLSVGWMSRKGELFVPFRRMHALWFVLDTCEAFEYREIRQMIDWNLTHKFTHTVKLTQFYLHFLDAPLALKFESSFQTPPSQNMCQWKFSVDLPENAWCLWEPWPKALALSWHLLRRWDWNYGRWFPFELGW